VRATGSGIGGDDDAVPPAVPDDSSVPLSGSSPATGAQPQSDDCASKPFRPDIRPASEPTCCGSGCDDCPF